MLICIDFMNEIRKTNRFYLARKLFRSAIFAWPGKTFFPINFPKLLSYEYLILVVDRFDFDYKS